MKVRRLKLRIHAVLTKYVSFRERRFKLRFLLDLTILSLFSLIILAVLRNVFKGVFFWGYGSGGGVEDAGGSLRKALLGVCGQRGGYEEEVVVVRVGDVYVVGTVLDDWYAAPAHAVKRLLEKLLNVDEEEVSLEC